MKIVKVRIVNRIMRVEVIRIIIMAKIHLLMMIKYNKYKDRRNKLHSRILKCLLQSIIAKI